MPDTESLWSIKNPLFFFLHGVTCNLKCKENLSTHFDGRLSCHGCRKNVFPFKEPDQHPERGDEPTGDRPSIPRLTHKLECGDKRSVGDEVSKRAEVMFV